MVQVVHLGIRKTGTSTFQRTIMRAQDAGVNILYGKQLLKGWIQANPISKDGSTPDYEALENIFRAAVGRHAILSHEGLAVYDQTKLAEVIKKVLPEAKILLTVRAPDSFLRSQYKHHVLNGGVDEASTFSDRYCRRLLLKLLNVKRFVNSYAKAGLRGQLTVLPYEWQREDYDSYLDFMTEYCALDLRKHHPSYTINKSPGPQFNELIRRLNAMLVSKAPDVLKSAEFGLLLRMESMSTAQTPELKGIFDVYYEELRVEYEHPRVPEHMWPKFSEQMKPLRRIKQFEPYLAEYRLKPLSAE
jgi:hypothetical protein